LEFIWLLRFDYWLLEIMKILGLDPGTATTGYGVIECDRMSQNLIAYGVIKTGKENLAHDRLAEIYDDVCELIERYKPDSIVIEKLYFAANSKTALAVGQARGVLLLAASKAQIPVIEITPLQVKQGLTGYGKAEKKQVQEMVKVALGLKEVPKPDDSADALALAIVGGRY
jgi:crossover junction endodeoxyribonuclease RuvC